MPFLVAPELVEPVTRSLLGAIDTDAGPTGEQLAVLRAVVTYLFERPDLDLAALTPLGPEEAANAIAQATGADIRRIPITPEVLLEILESVHV